MRSGPVLEHVCAHCRRPSSAPLCWRCVGRRGVTHKDDPYDKSRDKPAWMCCRKGCDAEAAFRCPAGGAWRACWTHKLHGDEPITEEER